MSGFQPWLSIGFGWLLGLFAPLISDWFRQRIRARKLRAALAGELHELQYKMALVSMKVHQRFGNITDDWLTWFETVVRNYSGLEATSESVELATLLRKVSEQERKVYLLRDRKPNRGLGLMQYDLPFLNAHVGEISIFPIPFQSALLRIKNNLDLFNQLVTSLQRSFDQTFDSSLSPENRQSLVSNLEQGYEALARRAEVIAKVISNVR